jgi:cyclophilin family peptidyl-prolyl cis-trans isomerase
MTAAKETLILVLNIGTIIIELLPGVAPQHVAQIQNLVESKAYDGVVFHRVIDGFMAQTGDVKFGHHDQLDTNRVGTGGSDLPNIPAEFGPISHIKGNVSMARSQNPNSANSQFFICLADVPFLDGQYSVFGRVVEGMDIVERIKKGHPQSGSVNGPDYIITAYLK